MNLPGGRPVQAIVWRESHPGRCSENQVEPSDVALMERIRDNDEEAFATFVSRYQRRFYRLAYGYVRNHEESLDAVQEAFIKVYKARATWEPRANPFTWAYRIVANHCIDMLRKRRGNTFSLDDGGDDENRSREFVDHDAVDPLRAQVQREEGERVRLAILKLPNRQREVLILRHYEGLSLQEIAESQDCALGTVKSSLHRALGNLKGILEGQSEKAGRGETHQDV
jgi:RNA polymerase sigma-70 factor (ECF subfamily)